MLINYFLLAFRNLKKQRGYTIVNTLGLAIGLAAAVALGRVIRSLLFGVTPFDATTLVAVPIVLGAMALIASWIPERARVLDLGCGDGVLLAGLAATHGVRGYGVEIDDASVLECVANDVNVLQVDLESGLSLFADGSFDCVT